MMSDTSKIKRKLSFDEKEDNVENNKISKKTKQTVTSSYKVGNKVLTYNCDKSNEFYQHWDFKLDTLNDILSLGKFYKENNIEKDRECNIPFFKISKIVDPVKKLINMVGLKDVKIQIFNLIVFYLQNLDKGNKDMLHTVVYGGPGVGKTKFIGILADVYANLGVLPSNKVTFAKRADMVGQYLGQTAIKTKNLIESAKGGILVIDEAYSLGDTEQKDSFARECIDTLNQYLSESKKDLICIIAGYKEDLDKRFFKTNPGLARRFPFRFTINDYSASNLKDIFISIVKENGWDLEKDSVDTKLLEEYRDNFPYNGGDMELLFTKVKFIHSLRVFSDEPCKKKTISREDFNNAVEDFVNNDEAKEQKYMKEFLRRMYI
jgi:hypothetical protein